MVLMNLFTGQEQRLKCREWTFRHRVGQTESSTDICSTCSTWGFPGGSAGKESACNARDPGSIPGLGRSPGEGHGNPLQYSCLENPMDRGVWQATVNAVPKS